jgi:hypothetical protein
MKLSIRAIGLLTILQKTKGLDTVTKLVEYCDESQQYVEHTLKELATAGCILLNNNTIELSVTDSTTGLEVENVALEDRIYDMFHKSKTYEVIAWFLAQLDKTFELDSELRERVLLEYDAASVVRFWDSYNIEQALKRSLVDKSVGNVTLDDLRQLLVKRDKGELVWQK